MSVYDDGHGIVASDAKSTPFLSNKIFEKHQCKMMSRVQ